MLCGPRLRVRICNAASVERGCGASVLTLRGAAARMAQLKSLPNSPPPLPPTVPCGSPFCITSFTHSTILFWSANIFVSASLSVTRSALRPPNPTSIGMLVMPYSIPRSVIRPFDSSLESSSASAKAMVANLSVGEGVRSRTRDVSRGVTVRHGTHAEVVKRVSRSVFDAEHERR